jgi:hypothetical protein
MRTFKKYFEDNELGDIDIIARPPNAEPENLGQTTDAGKRKISNIITSIQGGSEELVRKLVDDSEFTNNLDEYYKGLFTLINDDRYDIDWRAFKRHIDERFLENKLEDILAGSHGEFDLRRWAIDIIQRFVRNDPKSFFDQLFDMGFKIRNTAVGGGEFALAILGNGKKGDKGDVDVPKDGQRLGAGNMVLEVGTQMKIIGDATMSRKPGISSFDKKVAALLQQEQLPANKIIRTIAVPTADAAGQVGLGGDYTSADTKGVDSPSYTGYVGPQKAQREEPPMWEDDETKKQFIISQLKTYVANGNINENDYDTIYDKLLASIGPEDIDQKTGKPLGNAPASKINRIVGAVVLYDYIINHKDDVLVSINAGIEVQEGFDPYHTRWVKVGKNGGLDVLGVIDLMLNGWFNFNILPNAVKFTLGTPTGPKI